uniref:Uncharacterized protein n=1 Tax=Chromera velia CCMP2878 TaxID=1169474 RepID=A0A0G4HJB3_9ALVE|eukprot:Cvel_28080.t1-p1 / transcript=Cvel_28080.t1 / gene=Cvel_28080 / organism=Chromera_velia_CCMP2878 / gene_product=hypothetical protein / transcript_product=hypothetical protein / location=Cvel_scaffold3611:1013-1420(-) / protein_length=136 / sequence_SO=supercontig / SO=protein_coding / is_pseudo=false
MKRAPAARRKDGKYGATLCMDGTKITRKHVYHHEKEVRPGDFNRDGDDLSDNDGCEHDLAEEMRGVTVEGKNHLKVDEEINFDEIQRLLEEHLRETNAVDQLAEEGKLQDSDAEVNVSGQTEQREANLEVVTDFLM